MHQIFNPHKVGEVWGVFWADFEKKNDPIIMAQSCCGGGGVYIGFTLSVRLSAHMATELWVNTD